MKLQGISNDLDHKIKIPKIPHVKYYHGLSDPTQTTLDQYPHKKKKEKP